MKKSILSLCVALCLSGCVTASLQTKTTMAQSIFMEPTAESEKIIFLAIRNTSGHDINLAQKLENALLQKGYKITKDPNEATFILQTNVLYCDIKQENNATAAATVGAAAGAGVGIYNHSSATAGAIGAAAGAVAGGLLGKLTEDTVFQMQVDINIRQKSQNKVLASNGQNRGAAQVVDRRRAGFTNSFGGPVLDTQGGGELYDNTRNYNDQLTLKDYTEYQTTLLAEATKLNLKLEEALPALEDQVVRQISGIF